MWETLHQKSSFRSKKLWQSKLDFESHIVLLELPFHENVKILFAEIVKNNIVTSLRSGWMESEPGTTKFVNSLYYYTNYEL